MGRNLILENILFACLLVAGLTPVILYLNRLQRWRFHALGLLLTMVVLGVTLIHRPSEDMVLKTALPGPTTEMGFVPSSSCRSCHPSEYATWYGSYHRTMTQVAHRDTVLAPFDGQQLDGRGRRFTVEQRGDEFWVNEWLAAGSNQQKRRISQRRVVMLTGSHYQQIYWTTGYGDGTLRQFPWVYEITEKRWIPTEDSFLHPSDSIETEKIWNRNCIRCHSVGQRPNYTSQRVWETKVTEIGIACSACHGPAEDHIAAHKNPLARFLARTSDTQDETIVNPANLNHRRASQVCAQCHAYVRPKPGFFDHGKGQGFRAGARLLDHYTLQQHDGKPSNQFWPDGSVRTGGREYNSMILSGCYTGGQLSCMSCHSMHVDNPQDQIKAKMDGNEACNQCHTTIKENVSAHTHHRADSQASLCYNCHMPYTGYALLGTTRTHRISTPKLTGMATDDQPNACNLCHLERTFSWTAKYLREWYEQEPQPVPMHLADISASVVWLLRGNAAQRAITAWHYGQDWTVKGTEKRWVIPYLADLLTSDYSALRMIAYRSLRSILGRRMPTFDYVGSPQHFETTRDSVLAKWRLGNTHRKTSFSSETLLDHEGQIHGERARTLRQQRDNSRVFLAE
jgi:hypothetical protein